MTAPTITLRKVEGEELPFRVTVEPEPEGVNLSGRFPDHRSGFGFAVGLRMTIGGTVVDLSGDASGDASGEAAALIGMQGGSHG